MPRLFVGKQIPVHEISLTHSSSCRPRPYELDAHPMRYDAVPYIFAMAVGLFSAIFTKGMQILLTKSNLVW